MEQAVECPGCGDRVFGEVDVEPGRLTVTFTCDGCGKEFAVPVVEWDEDTNTFEPMGHRSKRKDFDS
jgi:transcription elongation factor Elf1